MVMVMQLRASEKIHRTVHYNRWILFYVNYTITKLFKKLNGNDFHYLLLMIKIEFRDSISASYM